MRGAFVLFCFLVCASLYSEQITVSSDIVAPRRSATKSVASRSHLNQITSVPIVVVSSSEEETVDVFSDPEPTAQKVLSSEGLDLQPLERIESSPGLPKRSLVINSSHTITREAFMRLVPQEYQGQNLWDVFIEDQFLILADEGRTYATFNFAFEDVIEASYPQMMRAIRVYEYMRGVFGFFWDQAIGTSYLIPQFYDVDSERGDIWASTVGMGFACVAYTIGVEQDWVPLSTVLVRLKAILSFFANLPETQCYRGFYAHFYNISSGELGSAVEFSTLDTAWLIIGALTVKQYVLSKKIEIESDETIANRSTIVRDIVNLVDQLYRRVQWNAALSSNSRHLIHGWDFRKIVLSDAQQNVLTYEHFDESILLYLLAIGAPLNRVSEDLWSNILRNTSSVTIDSLGHTEPVLGYDLGLFVHTYPQAYIDMRGYRVLNPNFIPTELEINLICQTLPFKDAGGYDYFANSQNAVKANREHTRSLWQSNSSAYTTYERYWGLSPAWSTANHYDILEPFRPLVDARVAPSMAMATLVFDEMNVYQQFRDLEERRDFPADFGNVSSIYGFISSFTLDTPAFGRSAIFNRILDIDKGAEILMLENYLTGMVWDLLSKDERLCDTLNLLGFPTFLFQESPAAKDSLQKIFSQPTIELARVESLGSPLANGAQVNDRQALRVRVKELLPGVASYQLEISRASSFSSSVVLQEVSLEGTLQDVNPFVNIPVASRGGQGGNYYYRLRARRPNQIDRNHTVYSAWSQAHRLNIVLSHETIQVLESGAVIELPTDDSDFDNPLEGPYEQLLRESLPNIINDVRDNNIEANIETQDDDKHFSIEDFFNAIYEDVLVPIGDFFKNR